MEIVSDSRLGIFLPFHFVTISKHHILYTESLWLPLKTVKNIEAKSPNFPQLCEIRVQPSTPFEDQDAPKKDFLIPSRTKWLYSIPVIIPSHCLMQPEVTLGIPLVLLGVVVFAQAAPCALCRAEGQPRTCSKEDSFGISFDNYHKVIMGD